MVQSIHSVIEQWTGTAPMSCPWSAFRDPFTLRVLCAIGSEELSWSEPDPSNRMVEGVAFYRRCAGTVTSKRREQEREHQRTSGGGEVIRG